MVQMIAPVRPDPSGLRQRLAGSERRRVRAVPPDGAGLVIEKDLTCSWSLSPGI